MTQTLEFGNVSEITAIETSSEIEALEVRERIEALQKIVESCEQVEIPLTHIFADGIYAREGTILKGTILVGKIHKTLHIDIISKGDISVVTEHGIKRIKAPCTLLSPPGTKRVGYAHEDTVWTTIIGTDSKDHEDIETRYVASTWEEFLALPTVAPVGGLQCLE